jgi:hypothetical protein
MLSTTRASETRLTGTAVGLTVARAAGGLGMDLVAFDPYANPSLAASANVELVSSIDELLEVADFLTIHTPLIASTKGMISGSELAKMKPSARILNVARGGMIDETALLAALEAGTIAGAGIDVQCQVLETRVLWRAMVVAFHFGKGLRLETVSPWWNTAFESEQYLWLDLRHQNIGSFRLDDQSLNVIHVRCRVAFFVPIVFVPRNFRSLVFLPG